MKHQSKYGKFQLHLKNIEALEKENSRFKRIYSEYENMSHELWNIENSKEESIPDDFINYINENADSFWEKSTILSTDLVLVVFYCHESISIFINCHNI